MEFFYLRGFFLNFDVSSTIFDISSDDCDVISSIFKNFFLRSLSVKLRDFKCG